MAAFLIAAATNERIEICDSETPIGRGPFLKVVDKRVSRTHATLQLKDDILSVKPVHKNPTFLRSVGQTKFVPLPKDVCKELFHGDTISLLPNDLIFSVEISREDNTQPYDIAGDVVESNTEEQITTSETGVHREEKKIVKDADSACGSTIATLSPTKKRTLPSWMLETALTGNNKTTVKKSPVKKKKTKNGDSSHDTKGVEQKTEEVQAIPLPENKKVETSPTSLKTLKQEVEDSSLKESSKKQCPYGANCYRKNPAHLEEYSHSSTPSDKSKDVDEKDKPECEYGTSCYRTNTEHMNEYKHTMSPEKTKRIQHTRTRKQVKGKSVLENTSDDDGQANTYDYDDSFLNDDEIASSDSYEDGEDSDFKPDQQDDVEDEDLSELVNEANEFVNNKNL